MWRDLKHSLRRLRLDWQFSLAAVLILALGIGVNTAIFSVVNAVLFHPQPYADVDRMVNLYQTGGQGVSYPAYRDMAASGVFSGVAAILGNDARYQSGVSSQTVMVEHVTSNYLEVIGFQPSAGRWFTEADQRAGSESLAVISYQSWVNKFASDYRAIGRSIRLNGVPVTIVGVGPREFSNSTLPVLFVDFWLNMGSLPAIEGGNRRERLLERREDPAFDVRARLKDGVSVSQAQAAMDVLGKRLAQDYPNVDPGRGIRVLPTTDVLVNPGEVDTMLKLGATLVMSIVALVLAIACSNLATLLLVRGTGRAQEISVRLAVGATRWQLIRHFLLESVLLALSGAIAGFVLARWTIRYLTTLPSLTVEVSPDYRVFAFTLGLAVVTGILFGLAPALRSTKVDLLPALRGESGGLSSARGWFTLKNALLTGQVAGSFLLLMGTGILIREVFSMQTGEMGFAIERVAMVRTSARFAGYGQVQSRQVYRDLLQRIQAIPGVQSAFAANSPPVGSSITRPLEIEGYAAANGVNAYAEATWAGPGYFETLEIPVLFGRTFTDLDQPSTPRVAVVNEAMARKFFGSPNAVGRRFSYGEPEGSQEPKIEVEIIGVARDTHEYLFEKDPIPLFYLSSAQGEVETSMLVARTSLDAAGLLQAMQREVRALDPELPIFQARTMAQNLEARLSLFKTGAGVLGGLGALGIALACIGLYAVVRFAVSKRSVELGIRMALGARSGQVTWLVMRDVVILTVAGIIAGSVISLGGFAVLEAVGGDVPGADPVTAAAVAFVMAGVGALAAYMPARRAAVADPLMSLRHH